MDKRYYDTSSIERVLQAYERGYGLSSADFYAAHVVDAESVADVPGYHRQSWAGFYRTWKRMSDNSFAEQVERELEPA